MHVPANAVQAVKVWGPPGCPAALGDLQGVRGRGRRGEWREGGFGLGRTPSTSQGGGSRSQLPAPPPAHRGLQTLLQLLQAQPQFPQAPPLVPIDSAPGPHSPAPGPYRPAPGPPGCCSTQARPLQTWQPLGAALSHAWVQLQKPCVSRAHLTRKPGGHRFTHRPEAVRHRWLPHSSADTTKPPVFLFSCLQKTSPRHPLYTDPVHPCHHCPEDSQPPLSEPQATWAASARGCQRSVQCHGDAEDQP